MSLVAHAIKTCICTAINMKVGKDREALHYFMLLTLREGQAIIQLAYSSLVLVPAKLENLVCLKAGEVCTYACLDLRTYVKLQYCLLRPLGWRSGLMFLRLEPQVPTQLGSSQPMLQSIILYLQQHNRHEAKLFFSVQVCMQLASALAGIPFSFQEGCINSLGSPLRRANRPPSRAV